MKPSPSRSASRRASSSDFLLRFANGRCPRRGRRVAAEVALDPADDVVEVDAQHPERLGVALVQLSRTPRPRPEQRCQHLVRRRPELREHRHRDALALREDRLEQVLRPDLPRAGRLGPLDGRLDDRPGPPGEPLEHLVSLSSPVLLVHGLPADAEHVGDLLPRPAFRTGAAHLRLLEVLEQTA